MKRFQRIILLATGLFSLQPPPCQRSPTWYVMSATKATVAAAFLEVGVDARAEAHGGSLYRHAGQSGHDVLETPPE